MKNLIYPALRMLFMTLILFFFFNTKLDSQVTSAAFDTAWAAKIQAAIDNALPTSGLHGVSVALTFPGMGTFFGVSGESTPGVPVTSDMEFGIGSNTKLFTAVLALKLQELGYFSLDDPLSDWVPSFNYIDPSATLRQCLGHQTGFFDFSNDIDPTDYAVVYGPDTLFTPAGTMARIGPPHFPVGTRYSYSNTNYTLVALAIEAASGQSYLENLHQYILDPLDMDSTFLAGYESPTGNICDGWFYDDDLGNVPRTAVMSMYWSAGGIYSTASEMTQWYNHLFEGDIINTASLEELTHFEPTSFYSMGLEHVIYPPLPDDDVYSHGGEAAGYSSTMAFDVKRHFSLAVLTNQFPGTGNELNSIVIPIVIALYDEYTRRLNDAGITLINAPTSSYCSSPIQPKVILKNFGTSNLTNVAIRYQLDNGAEQSYTWTGNLIQDQTVIISLPAITVSPGQHNFKAYTKNPNGNPEGYTFNDGAKSVFQVYASSVASGITEAFEGTFPPAGWLNGNQMIFDWQQTFLSSYTGDACLVKNFWNDNSGRSYDLDLPLMDLSSFSNPVLGFEYAYGFAGQGYNDELEILISDDCGTSFHSLFHKAGKALRTADDPNLFFPNHNQWRLKAFNLNAYRDEVIIKFRAITANGNNLYLDNLSITDKSESCPAPTNLDATFTSPGVVKLSWQFYGQAQEFRIYYHKVGELSWALKVVNGNKSFVNIQNLSSNTDYEWYMVAKCASGNSADSEVSLFTTPAILAPIVNSSAGLNAVQVIPNPVNNVAQIFFSLDQPERVTLLIVDAFGKTIITMTEQNYEAGDHEISWTPDGIPAGLYFLWLHKASGPVFQKFIIAKS